MMVVVVAITTTAVTRVHLVAEEVQLHVAKETLLHVVKADSRAKDQLLHVKADSEVHHHVAKADSLQIVQLVKALLEDQKALEILQNQDVLAKAKRFC